MSEKRKASSDSCLSKSSINDKQQIKKISTLTKEEKRKKCRITHDIYLFRIFVKNKKLPKEIAFYILRIYRLFPWEEDGKITYEESILWDESSDLLRSIAWCQKCPSSKQMKLITFGARESWAMRGIRETICYDCGDRKPTNCQILFEID